MLRDVADAIETLEEAGSRFYSITGAGTHISFEPESDNATAEDAIARFQKDWSKLGPGIYTVNHKKAKTDTRTKASFRINKSPEFVGAAAMGTGYDSTLVTQLQIQLEQMKHQQELNDLRRRHEDEVRRLKESNEGPSGPDKLLQIIAQMNQLVNSSKPGAIPALPTGGGAVAGAASLELSEVANQAVEAIHNALGANEAATINALRKIGALASNNPGQIQQVISMLG